jgi:hypothetical protein
MRTMGQRKCCAYKKDKGLITAQVLSLPAFVFGLYFMLAGVGSTLAMIFLFVPTFCVVRKWVFIAAAVFETLGVVGQILHALWAEDVVKEEDCSEGDEDSKWCKESTVVSIAVTGAFISAVVTILTAHFVATRFDALQAEILQELQ